MYYVGDIGTEIIVDTGINLITASLYKLKVIKPDGTTVEWVPVIYRNRFLKYRIILGDWDLTGVYELQAYVEIGTWKGHGNKIKFTVSEHI